MLTINVTKLTAARLEVVLERAEQEEVSVLALQETRHPPGGFRWAASRLRRAGWHAAWSPAATRGPERASANGGTLLCWRAFLGRSGPFDVAEGAAETDHRCSGRVFGAAVWASLYGPAQRPDASWLMRLARLAAEVERPAVLVGDFNWGDAYRSVEVLGFRQPDAQPPTVVGGSASAPTRCLVLGGEVLAVDVFPLAGVPHHAAVVYTVAIATAAWRRQQRLRSTARYEWRAVGGLAPTTGVSEAVMCRAADAAACRPTGASEADWSSWHARAEAAFRAAAQQGWVDIPRQAERAKGSAPSERPAAGAGLRRRPMPIELRRWQRLHRAAAEMWHRLGPVAPLTEAQARHWAAAQRSGLLADVPLSQAAALETASAAIARLQEQVKEEERRKWKQSFAAGRAEAIRAAKHLLKCQPASGEYTADEMETDWREWWCGAAPGDGAAAWCRVAAEAGLEPAPPRAEGWELPTWDAFRVGLSRTKGAAGFDGWSGDELKALCEHAPALGRELYELLCRTSMDVSSTACGAGPSPLQLFWWRVVGIPKKNSMQARPIAVGNVMLRAWHGALLKDMPQPLGEQFCGREGESAVTAIVDWLAQPSRHGLELDLEKAFDSIRHDAAGAALQHLGAPMGMVRFLQRGSWGGRRVCNVSGELSGGLWPSRGVPPGDPLSPAVMSALLAAWPGFVRRRARADCWLYMDDRSVKVQGAVPSHEVAGEVEAVKQATAEHDAAIGVVSNVGKMQEWAADESCEHLGLRLCGGGGPVRAVPRDGWAPFLEACARLSLLPTGGRTREVLYAVFVLPKLRWAAPLLYDVPEEVVTAIWRALTRTRCTWWCRGRFFADRLELHPRLGLSVAALAAAERTKAWKAEPVIQLLRQHAARLGLRVVSASADAGLWVAPAAGADARIVEAAGAAHQTANVEAPDSVPRWPGAFRPADAGAGGHALRVAGRVQCLKSVNASRHDAEGKEEVDVEVLSDKRWKRWVRSLSTEKATALRVWRGGAVLTPTRRFFGREAEGSADCIWCGAGQSSARHLFAECRRFEAARRRLSADLAVEEGWWAAQPRIVAKSGWVLRAPALEARRRVDRLIAANALGIEIVMAAVAYATQWFREA